MVRFFIFLYSSKFYLVRFFTFLPGPILTKIALEKLAKNSALSLTEHKKEIESISPGSNRSRLGGRRKHYLYTTEPQIWIMLKFNKYNVNMTFNPKP